MPPPLVARGMFPWMGVRVFFKVVVTFNHVGGSFNLLVPPPLHQGCPNNPIFSNMGLNTACWAYFMYHHISSVQFQGFFRKNAWEEWGEISSLSCDIQRNKNCTWKSSSYRAGVSLTAVQSDLPSLFYRWLYFRVIGMLLYSFWLCFSQGIS